jgi:hypothetical protein
MKKRNIFLGKRHHEICGVDKKDIKHLVVRLDSRGSVRVVMDGDLSLSLARRLREENGTTQPTPIDMQCNSLLQSIKKLVPVPPHQSNQSSLSGRQD